MMIKQILLDSIENEADCYVRISNHEEKQI